jgi:D-glycero-D-manno-heptose 1,7-bisphosphate phosphatase
MPKPMLPVAGEPFLDILLRNIARHGVTEIVLLARHHAQKVRDHYASGQIGGAVVRVIEETAQAGTGGALREAAADLDEVFLLSNGDSFFDVNYLALLQQFTQTQAQIAIALREVPDSARYGRVTVEATGTVTRFAEKTAGATGPGLINGGVYIVSRRVLDHIGPGQVSLESDVIPVLVQAGQVCGQAFGGYFLDIGLPETYAQAQYELPAVDRRKVTFFDRDGTLTRDDGYTHRVEDLEFLPGAVACIRRMNDLGRLVIVVTNQAGIARGYYTQGHTDRFHAAMQTVLQAQGAHIDAFLSCPHHPDFSPPCSCRKPGTGLFEQACAQFRIDLDGAVMIGDKPTDIEAAHAFGIGGVLTDGTDLAQICSQIEP